MSSKTDINASPDSFHSPDLLTSERMTMKYGNYGVEVLQNNLSTRLSSLYNTANSQRSTRIFAVVIYDDNINNIYQEEHSQICEGHSIGQIFRDNGWKILKNHLYIGNFIPSHDFREIYNLMNISPSTPLSACVYQFNVHKFNSTINYATICEIYHPDFLSLIDLSLIYKLEQRSPDIISSSVATILKKVREQIRKYNSN